MEEFVVITEYTDEKGVCLIADKEIHIKLSVGSIRLMHESLDAVREMWWRELQRLGVLPISMNDVPAPRTPFPPCREQEGEAALLSIKLMRGERFKQTMMLRKYNYHTSQVEPVDLSGATIQSSIYQDSHGFDLKIKHREIGEESIVQVPISDAELQKIMALQNEYDKQV